MGNFKKSLIFLLFFLFINTTYSATNEIEERIDQMLSLYNSSKDDYYQKGPKTFWERFSYLSDQEEIDSILQSIKGLADLPSIEKVDGQTVLIKNNNYSIKLAFIDLDQQIIRLNDERFTLPLDISLKELAEFIQSKLNQKNASSPSILILQSLVFSQRAEASIPIIAGIGAFIAAIFTKGANGNKNKAANKANNRRASRSVSKYKRNNKGHIIGVSRPTLAANISNESDSEDLADQAIQRANIPDAEPSPSPAPPQRTTASPPAQKVEQKRPSTEGNDNSIDNIVFPQTKIARDIPKDQFGSQCTIVFARHGDKTKCPNSKYNDCLTEDGIQQAKDLSNSLIQFEKDYNLPFDFIGFSDQNRSQQTAKYFREARPNLPTADSRLQKIIKECDQNAGCDALAQKFFEEIKTNLCRKNTDGTPKTIFITSHGNIGGRLLKLMVPSYGNFDMDFAKPYVLTSDNGSNYRVLHPKK